MTPAEADRALDTLVILYDTREQDTARLRARLEQIRALCPVERCTLPYGDYSARLTVDGEPYMLPVSVERKMNLDEMCQCFCNGRKRFSREFERMEAAGGKMYLLLENASWDDVYKARYRSKMLPQSLIASLFTWLARYHCQLLFCPERTTGRLIHDLLKYEAREMLQRMVLSDDR